MTDSSTRGDNVVVGIDFSEQSARALSEAVALTAERPDALLHVVHVALDYGPMLRLDIGEEVLTLTAEEATRFVEKHMETFLESHAANLPAERLRAHVGVGAASDELVRVAADVDADLIVVGTHGRTGMRRLLLGSVAEAVVRKAGCPVLVVRDKDYSESED